MTSSYEIAFLELRRKIIEREFNRLNDMQLRAVLATEGPLLLLAGAGSGKTTVIINRIANLIIYGRACDSDEIPEQIKEDDVRFLESYLSDPSEKDAERAKALVSLYPVDPWRIIAITFTNKAAEEMRERLAAMLGDSASDIWASTFHSACVRILRRDITWLEGFGPGFTIYDTTDSLLLLKRIIKDMDLDEKSWPPRSVLTEISTAKDAQLDSQEYSELMSDSRDPRKKRIAEIYTEYAKRLRAANALDFDDIILHTVRLLKNVAEVREYWQRRFRYVLVDEFQDTNRLQYELVSLLSAGHRNICVVGDDDQSIYKFRGATIENILGFENDYPESRVIRLEQNYRSTGCILEAANAVICNNSSRKGKELWTKNTRGEKIDIYRATDETDEADYIAKAMLAGYRKGQKWRDFAVLYRMNAQSNRIEFALKRNGIPYRVIGGMKFFERAEIKDMLAYLCVINNTNDDLRLLRIVNTPPRGIGDKTLEQVRITAVEEESSVFEVMRTSSEREELRKAAPRLMRFVELTEHLAAVKHLRLDELYDVLLDKSGYMSMLNEKDTIENNTRRENILELKSNIISFLKENGDEAGLAQFLDEVALYTDIDQYDIDADSVVLMTIHSAKGLEFPTVFIAGAEEGIFPGIRSIGEREELEEERRLCYVALTRAKEKLIITSAKQRMLFGRTTNNQISRFATEIPENCVEEKDSALHLKPRKSGGYVKGENVRRTWDFSDIADVGQITDTVHRYSKESVSQKSNSAVTDSNIKLNKGDRVEHNAFGSGMVISVTPTGGDALIEIAFDKVGTKKLMLKFAAQYMRKL